MIKPIFYLTIILIILSHVNSTFAQENPLIYQTFVREAPGIDNSGQIIILDALKLKPIDRIVTTPFQPESIVVADGQNLAFVINDPIVNSKKGLFVIDLTAKKVLKAMFEGIGIYGAKSDLQNNIWVLLNEPKQLAIINPENLQLVDTIQLTESPRDIIFSQDGKRAYISLVNSDVIVLNVMTRGEITILRNLPKGDSTQTRHQELALSSDGNALYVGSNDTISIFNTSSFPIRITDKFTLPPTSSGDFLLKSSFDKKFLYIAEYLGSDLYIYNTETKKMNNLRSPRESGILSSLNLSSDGKVLYASGFYGVAILDTQTNSFIKTILTSTEIGSPNPFSLGATVTGDFSIGKNPALQVSSPSTNDNFVSGQEVKIRWQTIVAQQSYSLASHAVELSTDGGQTFAPITGAEELPATAQEFNWTVPNIEVIDKAQIRVSTVDLGARRALSTSGIFSIIKTAPGDTQAPIVNFLSPKGNEQFDVGNILQISWMSSDNVAVTSQDLSLSLDGGNTFPITIASGLIGTSQSFAFPIPESLSTNQARLRLVVKDAAGNMAQAVTLTNFTIKEATDSTPPTVTISNPSSNSSLIAGQSIQVNWQSTDNRAVVSQSLLISFDGGQNFTQIQAFGATDNSFVISNIDKLNFTTSQAIIRVTAKDLAGNAGQANTQFIIKPMITVASYQAKILSISGIGFMSNTTSNSSGNIQVLINDKVITVAPKTLNNMSVMLKGNKKKLNLVRGANNVQLMVDGVLSNQSSFQF